MVMVWDKKGKLDGTVRVGRAGNRPEKVDALIAEIDRLWEAKHQCVAAPGLVTENPAKTAS
jgi:hypothetical protein